MQPVEPSKIAEMQAKFSNDFANLEQSFSEKKGVAEAVEYLTSLVEIFIWAEKNDMTIVDFFIENNVMRFFPELLIKNAKQKYSRENVVTLIKNFSFLLLNLKSPELVNFVFSNQSFTQFLNFRFDFRDDEIIFFYVNFIKSISQRFDSFPLQIFYNPRNLDMPLFSNITRFMNHSDSLVRATAFNVVLTLLNCSLISSQIKRDLFAEGISLFTFFHSFLHISQI